MRLKNSGNIGENNANSGDLARLSPYTAGRSRGLRGVGFPNTSRLEAVYGHSLSIRFDLLPLE